MNQSFLVYGGIGAAAGGILSAVMVIISGFITEMILLLFGYSYIEYDDDFNSPVYSAVIEHSWGMGYRYCMPSSTQSYRYGMVVSLRHMWFGYITINKNIPAYGGPPQVRFVLRMWSLRDVSDIIGINNLLHANKRVRVRYIGGASFRVQPPDDTILAWQRQLSDMITRTQSPNGIVVLITGHPGCGKTTLPQISAYDMKLSTVYMYTSGKFDTISPHIYETDRKYAYHMCVDEFDDVINKMMNDKQTEGKAPLLSILDSVHMSTNPPVMFLTSNLTYDKLFALAGDNAAAIFRPGRVDIIAHVDERLQLHVLREYVPIAKKQPQPLDMPRPNNDSPKPVDSDDDTIVLSAAS